MNRLWIRLSLAFSAAVFISLLVFMTSTLIVVRSGVPFQVVVEEIRAPGGLADNLKMYYTTNKTWTGVETFLSNQGMSLSFPPDNGMMLSLVDADGKIIAGYEKGEQLALTTAISSVSGDTAAISGSSAPFFGSTSFTMPVPDGAGLPGIMAISSGEAVPAVQGVGGIEAAAPLQGVDIVAATPLQRDIQHDMMITIDDGGRTEGFLKVARRVQRPMPAPFEMLVNYLLSVLGTAAVIAGVVSVIFGIMVSRNLTAPLIRLADAARAIEARKLHRRVKVEGTVEIAAVAQAFNDMADSVQQATRLRQNLVADVAHELRTPLSVLQGNLRAIIDDVYPMSKQEISRLYDQTRLLSRLVNDLHELSQAEAHQLTLYQNSFDLAAMLHEQAGMFAALAEDEGLRVQIDAPASGIWIEADQARLVQVLNNLLANALAHTPAGGCIHVCLKAEFRTLALTVSDTGEGIDPQHLPYLFERFYRADTGRSRSKGGAGLGLAIVRALVQEHGGTIEAFSGGAGQGSTFIIRLPDVLVKSIPDRLANPA